MKVIYIGLISLAFIIILCCSCVNKISENKDMLSKQNVLLIDQKQAEIDEIFSLLAYSIVYRNWQSDSMSRSARRGYNIGSVLVNSNNEPVYYDLNSVGITKNSTQHGEVRLMMKYLEEAKLFDLKNYTIYTTLEPCAMCAGMMTMTSVKRTVYGQSDVEYSHAFERLFFDSRSIGGYAPYPRKVIVNLSQSDIKKDLDNAYQDFLKHDTEKILAKFLASENAREIYKKSDKMFRTYQVKLHENKKVYDKALDFYATSTLSNK